MAQLGALAQSEEQKKAQGARPVVMIKSPSDALQFLLGPEPATVTGGYGGWEVISRPRRVGVTHWIGKGPLTISLPIMMDSHHETGGEKNKNLETIIRRLEKMAMPEEGHPPPVIGVYSVAVPWCPLGNDMEWVITGLNWGDSIRTKGGFRTRQAVTIELLRYVSVGTLKVNPVQQAQLNVKPVTTKSTKVTSGPFPYAHIVKRGDTLVTIAARVLGDPRRWIEIANINNIRDPVAIRPGDIVRLP